MIEDDVRQLLQDRAAAVQPSSDGLEKIEAKLDAPVATTARRRAPMMAAAALIAIAAVAGIALLSQRNGGDHASVAASSSTSTSSTPTTSTPTATTAAEGVWPGPGDAIGVDPAVFHDPVLTAKAYVAARVVDVGATTASSFQPGDSRSGEVVFSGRVSTTVFVRQGVEDRWFVVGSSSDLLPVHDAGGGVLVMTADTAGDVSGETRSATGAVAPAPSQHVTEPGTELWRGSAGGAWFALDTGDGAIGLAEVRIVEPEPPAAAATVLTPAGTPDPRDAVVSYLRDRLDGRDVRVDSFTATDDTHGEVPWEAGVVRVVKLDDGWHVHEAIGDSIQIGGTSLDQGYIGGALTLAQAGTVHLTVGDVTWDVRNDVDREGTSVHFEHAVPTDEPVILRAVFDTDTGYVSIAEKVVG